MNPSKICLCSHRALLLKVISSQEKQIIFFKSSPQPCCEKGDKSLWSVVRLISLGYIIRHCLHCIYHHHHHHHFFILYCRVTREVRENRVYQDSLSKELMDPRVPLVEWVHQVLLAHQDHQEQVQQLLILVLMVRDQERLLGYLACQDRR